MFSLKDQVEPIKIDDQLKRIVRENDINSIHIAYCQEISPPHAFSVCVHWGETGTDSHKCTHVNAGSIDEAVGAALRKARMIRTPIAEAAE